MSLKEIVLDGPLEKNKYYAYIMNFRKGVPPCSFTYCDFQCTKYSQWDSLYWIHWKYRTCTAASAWKWGWPFWISQNLLDSFHSRNITKINVVFHMAAFLLINHLRLEKILKRKMKFYCEERLYWKRSKATLIIIKKNMKILRKILIQEKKILYNHWAFWKIRRASNCWWYLL